MQLSDLTRPYREICDACHKEIAMVLVAILSIGLLCALFIQPQEDESDEQTAKTAYVYSIPDGDAIQDDLEVKYE